MLGSTLQLSRSRPDDRLHNLPSSARRPHAQVNSPKPVEPEAHDELEQQRVEPVFEPAISPLSNLERFLDSVKPSVPAHYFSKTMITNWKTCGSMEFQPYFVLGDLWESFKEWSAYGAGVPLVMNDTDCVVQYYVPYLSAIQLYVEPSHLSAKSRQPSEDSDSDFSNSSSDGSSDCEPETGFKYSWAQRSHDLQTSDISVKLSMCSLTQQNSELQNDFSSEDGEPINSRGCLLFEYLEGDLPYSREPLADKISDLALRFPEIKTLKSSDLLPSSWMSVAWYPIYRIPIGQTLKDLEACFLTFHSLHTPIAGAESIQEPVVTYLSEIDGVSKMSLPVFGLASYKFKGSWWTSSQGSDCQLSQSLLQAADDWLTYLQVDHPDFQFFCRR